MSKEQALFRFLSSFFSRQHPFVAVDLNPASLKILQLSKTNGSWQVERYASKTLSPGLFEKQVLKNQTAFKALIKPMMDELNLTNHDAVLSIPDAEVTTKVIQVPESLHEFEIESWLVTEANHYFSYDIKDVYFDFYVLGPSLKKSTLVDVYFLAAYKEKIESRIQAFENWFHIKAVEIDSYAFERVLPLLKPPQEKEIIAIIELDAECMRLYVFKEMKILFVHEEASRRGDLESISVEQVKCFLDFFYSMHPDRQLSQLFLAGEQALLPGLTSLISENCNLKTQLATPFLEMNVELIPSSPAFLKALGLALRGQ